MIKIINRFDSIIEKLTKMLLVTSVLSLLILSTSSIFFRWFHVSILWIEPLIRHLVFLIAFLGGTIATGNKSHIGIDIIGKYFESKKNTKAKKIIDSMIGAISFFTLITLIYASLNFYHMEAKYSKVVFWNIRSHILVAIIPFGFSLIAFRFFVNLINDLFQKKEA